MTLSIVQVSLLLCGLALLCPCFVNGKYNMEDIDYFAKLCNATEEDIAVAKSYDVPSSETGKCFCKCLSKSIITLESDGSYNKTIVDKMLKKYWPETPVDILTKINDICYEKISKIISPGELRTCDYYYQIFKCLNIQEKLNGML